MAKTELEEIMNLCYLQGCTDTLEKVNKLLDREELKYTQVMRLSGKAEDVFKTFDELANEHGELTLGELAQNGIKIQ